MKCRPHFLFGLFVLAALPVGRVPVDGDSSKTTLRMYLGTGQYAYIERGCEGNIVERYPIPYQEASISVDHKTSGRFRFGINGSYIRDKRLRDVRYIYDTNPGYDRKWKLQRTSTFLVNPYFALDWKYLGMGLGIVTSNNGFFATESGFMAKGSASVRIGNPKKIYISASMFQDPPLLTSGYFSLGFGSDEVDKFHWWLGVSALPYDRAGYIGRASILVRKGMFLNWLFRLGHSEGVDENAIGVGLTYTLQP